MSFTDQANKDGHHGPVDPFASSIVASNHVDPFASIANDENRDLNTTINNQNIIRLLP